MTSGKKPGIAFWATVVLVLVLAYPLSFGPACWITSRAEWLQPAFEYAFWPLVWAANRTTPASWDLLRPYATCGMPEMGLIPLPECDDSGSYFLDRDRFFVPGSQRR